MTQLNSRTSHDVGTSSVQQRRVWASSFIGAAIEFYDFSIYSTASALVFAPLFFSQVDPAVGLMLSFATLAVGYAARPLGAVIFGHFGDKIGRKATLIVTIVLMAAATFSIGLLPTFAQIGVFAPIMLVLLRCLQGISVGGEWGGAVVMTTEHASAKRRVFMGSATACGAAAGIVIGYGVFAIALPLAGESFNTWGWRVPFLMTAVLFVLAIYMRLKVQESPIMQELKESAASLKRELPVRAVFTTYFGRVAMGALIFIGPMTINTLMMTFFLSQGVSVLGISRQDMVTASMIGVACSLVGIPLAALLTDRFGRRRILVIGISLAALNALLVWPMLSSGSFGLIVLIFCLVFAIHSLCYAPITAVYSEIFPSNIRYTGVSVTYQIAALIGGGLSPVAASSLVAAGFSPLTVIGMSIVLLLASLVAAARLKPTDNIDLREV